LIVLVKQKNRSATDIPLSFVVIFLPEKTMEKLDLSKEYKSYFTAKVKPELVEIGPVRFISITGKGDPSEEAFLERVQVLYSTAYKIKFDFKAKKKDFVVSKLEGFWWFDETKYPDKTIVNSSTEVPRSEWEYRLAIRLPDFVSKLDVEKGVANVLLKKDLPLVRQVEFYELTEGKCVQMLHVGPYSTEPETLMQIGNFTTKNKMTRNGIHHEIYLSDFRKTQPEKLKTILREPVRNA
jgi:hypothetical protein